MSECVCVSEDVLNSRKENVVVLQQQTLTGIVGFDGQLSGSLSVVNLVLRCVLCCHCHSMLRN